MLRKDLVMSYIQCKICKRELDVKNFYKKQRSTCKNCYNKNRQEKYKKSICRYCKEEFRPGIKGRYRYCKDECRLKDKIAVDDKTGCWNWQGSISLRGYGKIVWGSNTGALAHRVYYQVFKGNLKDNKVIIHSCDNTRCVNPEHLRIGTRKENTEDAQLKGRLKLRSRLTREHVINIRKLYHEGTSPEILAKMYKRSQGTIMDIVYRVSWKEI